MLGMLLQPQTKGAGQEMPGSTSTGAADDAPPPPPGPLPSSPGAQFASNTLANLISTQEQSTTSSSNLASQVLNQLDTDGDGELSGDEIKAALNQNPAPGSDAANGLNQAIGQLDTDGDGKLSASELSAGLNAEKTAQTAQGTQDTQTADATQTAQKPHGHHHHHGGGAPPTSTDLASTLIGGADSSGDGALSLDEIEASLGSGASAAANGITQAFGKLDANADGLLSSTELSSAIDAFRGAHQRGDAATAQASITA
jgi:Ca2+-binding EF-hand superfamily protein